MEEQKERHAGGNKWIGTGGTSPFGADGYNPEGFRIGQKKGRNGRAVKVWEKREFKIRAEAAIFAFRKFRVAFRDCVRLARRDRATSWDWVNLSVPQAAIEVH